MTQGIDERQRLEMALSFKVDPDTSEPLTPEREAEIRAHLDTMDAGSAMQGEATGYSVGTVDGTVGAQSVPQEPAGSPADIQALVQQEIARQLGGTVQQTAPQATFEDILNQIDPRDSDAALAMLAWLEANGRISPIATLNGGGGYLWHYSEPKGASKQGYTPGATQGGRMVDKAVDQARESGAKPRVTGMCGTCFSAVQQNDDGSISLDGDPTALTHDDGSKHDLN